MTDAEDNPGASVPRAEPVNFGSGTVTISGDARTVALIHRTDRAFNLFETMTLAGLATVAIVVSALMVMYAPNGREILVFGLSATGWVLALGLSGFAAIMIRASKSGVEIRGQSGDAHKAGSRSALFPGRRR